MDKDQQPILIVEDMPHILELIKVTLNFKGYQVMTATDGLDALEKINEQKPALIITDILMPRMDGYSFVQALRQREDTRETPVVFLSATYITPEDKAFALSLGAERFLEKPIDTEEFLLTIAELLTRTGPITQSRPIKKQEFYRGYRKRLEDKLLHKNRQIRRAERLLASIPAAQKESYQSLLDQAVRERAEVEKELNALYKVIDELKE